MQDKGRRQRTHVVNIRPVCCKATHEEMLREAAQIRLARRAAKATGTESLLGRMVKLLSRSSRPSYNVVGSDRTQHQQRLANAKSS
jgi:hypothetical protein